MLTGIRLPSLPISILYLHDAVFRQVVILSLLIKTELMLWKCKTLVLTTSNFHNLAVFHGLPSFALWVSPAGDFWCGFYIPSWSGFVHCSTPSKSWASPHIMHWTTVLTFLHILGFSVKWLAKTSTVYVDAFYHVEFFVFVFLHTC